jgi:hypothetical protein
LGELKHLRQQGLPLDCFIFPVRSFKNRRQPARLDGSLCSSASFSLLRVNPQQQSLFFSFPYNDGLPRQPATAVAAERNHSVSCASRAFKKK